MSLDRHLAIDTPQGKLFGNLSLPDSPRSLVIVPRGGDPHGPQARVTAALAAQQHAVLSIDLLTHKEGGFAALAQNSHLLMPRLLRLLDYLKEDGDSAGLPLGIFAVGPVAAAALRATAQRDAQVHALAIYQGLIDHAGKQYLEALATPLLVLLDIDEEDVETKQASTERAFEHISAAHAVRLINDLSLAGEACRWFNLQLLPTSPAGH